MLEPVEDPSLDLDPSVLELRLDMDWALGFRPSSLGSSLLLLLGSPVLSSSSLLLRDPLSSGNLLADETCLREHPRSINKVMDDQ